MRKEPDIGHEIMCAIIDAGIVDAAADGVVVWAANSPEVLEMIVARFAQRLHIQMLSAEL